MSDTPPPDGITQHTDRKLATGSRQLRSPPICTATLCVFAV